MPTQQLPTNVVTAGIAGIPGSAPGSPALSSSGSLALSAASTAHAASAVAPQTGLVSPQSPSKLPPVSMSIEARFSAVRAARSDHERLALARSISDHVAAHAREVSGEPFAKFMQLEVNKRIFELIHSNDVFHKMAGIHIIDCLIDFHGEENTTKITRFANYLRIVLPGTDPQISILASKALGRLAQPGGTLAAEFVEFEVKRALEWLQGDRNESRRYAAVLVLKELSLSSPTLIFSFVPQILELVWTALRDPKVIIRESGAEVLRVSLQLLQQRDTILRESWFKKIYADAEGGINKTLNPDSLHGSLLVYRELLEHTGKFMIQNYTQTSEAIIGLREHSNRLIRRTVIQLFPVLATFNTQKFVDTHLKECVEYLVGELKKDKVVGSDSAGDRKSVFLAIGSIANAVGHQIIPYLESIFFVIRENLVKARKRPADAACVFQCLSMLAMAVNTEDMKERIENVLHLMFATGLSEQLKYTLQDICLHLDIEDLALRIKERFLNMLSMILCGEPYRHPGAPGRLIPATFKDLQQNAAETTTIDTVILALHCLGSFSFSGMMLREIIRSCAVAYLDDDHPGVRKAAAITTCKLLCVDPVNYQTSNLSMRISGEILEKLLIVAITDPDASIRQTVLSLFDIHFDHHLAQAANIRSIFLALNDEVFAIREIAISILGRLTLHNPAYVLPPLRKILIRLLTELQHTNISLQKEECVKLLCALIVAAQRLVKPYVSSIMKVILPKTRDVIPTISATSIAAIGELSRAACEDMLPYFDQVMPIIIETLQDQSSAVKREAAVRTLGQMSSHTGAVITPYLEYSNLLDILIGVLKSEEIKSIRLETVKVMGILGALDPYRHKIVSMPESANAVDNDISSLPSPSSDEYYPTVVITALTKILRDTSLSVHHTAVVQAVMYMFETQGLKFVSFLSKIIPALLTMMRSCPSNMLEYHFTKLADLVTIVKQHIRTYLPDIFALINEFWSSQANLQIMILSLIEAIALALDSEFKVHLPALLPQILQIFEVDVSESKQLTRKALHAFVIFGATLEEYLYLVVPVVVRLFERQDVPLSLRKYSIEAAAQLSRRIEFEDISSKIVPPLLRILNGNLKDLKVAAMETIFVLACQMKQDFVLFILPIQQIMQKKSITHPKYEAVASKLLKKEPIPDELLVVDDDSAAANTEEQSTEAASQKVHVNQQQLRKAWDTTQRSTKEDWVEWMRRFSVELLKESPSHSLRSCASLAAVYNPLARDLFNAGFVSCWSELADETKDDLVVALEAALGATNISPEITQTLLNLAEFMEHDDKALPIDIRTLGIFAGRCHAWAKALHYKELEFLQDPLPDTIESLISINNQLQQPDSAIGILKHAQESQNIELVSTWYEKLNRWDDALAGYERKQAENPKSVEALFGRMRCLQNLGEWNKLSDLSKERWSEEKDDVKRIMAPLAAAAAWSTSSWPFMQGCVDMIKTESPDGAFFRSVMACHNKRFDVAATYIDKARELLDTELMALVGESYSRAYPVVVRIQMLAELDEVIMYKNFEKFPELQAPIRRTWMTRLKGCQKSVDVWLRILRVRALVLSPEEDSEMLIKFANLCRKNGKLGLAFKVLTQLLSTEKNHLGILDTSNNPPNVIYACLKHAWASGVKEVKEHAFDQLRQFTKTLVDRLDIATLNDINVQVDPAKADPDRPAIIKLLARCYLKLGEWQQALEEELNEAVIPEILRSYLAATHCDKTWYKAWHSWALSNFEALTYYERIQDTVQPEILISHVVPSIQGFFQSVALAKGNSLQDTLRVLTLWFKYGYHPDVNAAITEGFGSVSIDTWLQVIPQLIARIHTPNVNVRRLLHQLLFDVGRAHPQALVWSLTVASKSQSTDRMNAAVSIMEKMRTHSNALVEQVLLVSQELIRVAILWHEMWHEGLEEASRLYFGEQNIEGMFATLEPLHLMLERGPETLREISFNQAFGRDLQDALDWCKKFKRTQNMNDLNPAWDLYYHVFRRINKQLPHLTTLELQYVSPKLLAAKNLELAIPGTYKSGEDIVTIESFAPILTVITSKQRPRRLSIKGDNGAEFQFLLKGHEDLRQDERVMQLFGLVNTLLSKDSETFKRHLTIERFSAIPLSPNSGLIGWVPNCDTLHAIIKDYRESRKILLNIEHRLMLQMAPDYDNLTLLQKVEVFEYALANTTGQDLFKVLWLKSKNSEIWLDRRTNYTRSLAVMSMVGYILGLGDRHPSNLMLERFTGKVVHIDFGDCFEVAMHREKFPERIPFRLTRMLVNAMEVSGIEGNFRITCEHVMRVLRENKDSLMAVLEAFVHDPLINWRLLTNPSPSKDNKGPSKKLDIETMTTDLYGTSKKHHRATNESDMPSEEDAANRPEVLNARALTVITRVSNKLTGKDFKTQAPLDVPSQVNRLIQQATSMENLCQCYIGWCAFW